MKTFFLKGLPGICIILACAGFIKCQAQGIVGKWESVSAKSYLTPEAAKEMGSPVITSASGKDAGSAVNEFKSDHTFKMSVTPPGNTDEITMKGTWSLAGDQLKISMDSPGNPSTTITVLINGNTMIMSSRMAPPSRMTKVETTFRKVN